MLCLKNKNVTRLPQSERIDGSWLPLKNGQTRYLNIEAQRSAMVHGPMQFQSRLAVWNSLLNYLPNTAGKDEL